MSVPSILFNDSVVSSPEAKSECLNSFFSSCFNKSAPPLESPAPLSINSSSYLLCTPNEVYKLLLRTPSDTASGPDEFSSKMIRATASSISFPLSLIFNLSLSTGIFPSDWKNSLVIPIPKTTSPSFSPSNYRPIYLLSLISKALERHVSNYVYEFCSLHNLLHPSQFGFRPGRSTESALLTALNPWFSSLDKGKSVCSVFFDISKAFDSVPHAPLINTLSLLNLPSSLVHWFQSYLADRSQQVRIQEHLSSISASLLPIVSKTILLLVIAKTAQIESLIH